MEKRAVPIIEGEEPLSVYGRPLIGGKASWGQGYFSSTRTVRIVGFIVYPEGKKFSFPGGVRISPWDSLNVLVP